MSLKSLSPFERALLDHQAVNACIQQGHNWSGKGFPWPMCEIRQGQSGDLIAQQQGSGIDFSETRPYQTGDEPRHMNWRATARTGRPQVRVFQAELTPTSYFLIDRRATMRFGTRRRLKVAQAARLAIFLAAWEARNGAELGSLILNETAQWQPPASGEKGIYQLAQNATKPCPPMFDVPQPEMKYALALLAEQLPAGSHLYILSDFSDLTETLVPRLHQLGLQHRVWAISIHDPAEQQLPLAGQLQLIWNQQSGMAGDMIDKNGIDKNGVDKNRVNKNTTNRNRVDNKADRVVDSTPLTDTVINTHDTVIQQQHKQRFEQRQRQLKKRCESSGINFTAIFSDTEDLVKALQGTPQ